MANTKYAYVREFELPDPLLPGTFMLFRLDGHSFHRFSEKHEFTKPNDVRALQLMDHAARDLMEEYPDIILAFGESDEFSFLLRKSTTLYNRRQSKIVSTLTSLFTSCYVFHWSTYFPNTPLLYPPSFDGRIVLYPTEKHVRDYFAWRQADTHINNLYNTTFWSLVQQGGQTTTEAHATLRGTFSKDKHEILYSRFGINYNKLDAKFRKGSVLFREEVDTVPLTSPLPIADEATHKDCATSPTDEKIQNKQLTPIKSKGKKNKHESKSVRYRIELIHCDIIKDEFWDARPGLL
ncbi:tRNAHis guanylyltransferase, partial [Phlegmacium glaucopus]